MYCNSQDDNVMMLHKIYTFHRETSAQSLLFLHCSEDIQ